MHSLNRTSPKDGPFIGTCMKCGTEGLSLSDAQGECQNPANMSDGECLVASINDDHAPVERYHVDDPIIKTLWGIIDDIDTASDVAKGDNAAYRATVEALQAKRWSTGITTDGVNIFYPGPENEIGRANTVLRHAMRDDPEYAWAWFCNLAMPIMDAIGCSHEQANVAGAHLMSLLFDRDITKDPRFQYAKGEAQRHHEFRIEK